jgi:guanylate kinase
MSGHIYFIMGISGAGKWTLVKNIKDLLLDNLVFPLSYTTREKRAGEIDGDHYTFISRESFLQSIDDDEFLEYAIVHERDYYGTKKRDVLDNGVGEWKIVIKELDFNGLKKLKQENPELDSLYSAVFLNIPKEMLQSRIDTRGIFMSDEEYEKRIKSSIFEEEELMKYCDYVIDATLSPEEVVEKFLEIVRGEK